MIQLSPYQFSCLCSQGVSPELMAERQTNPPTNTIPFITLFHQSGFFSCQCAYKMQGLLLARVGTDVPRCPRLSVCTTLMCHSLMVNRLCNRKPSNTLSREVILSSFHSVFSTHWAPAPMAWHCPSETSFLCRLESQSVL